MRYQGKMVPGVFVKRPNRFIAHIEIDGKEEICHVKNTGRCRELLPTGAKVWCLDSQSDTRKTRYDLIAVQKGDLLINMDSQAPNKVAAEYLRTLFPDCTLLKAEVKHGNSRFDFYMERPDEKWFIEVKGVTLEEGGIVRFPDAPTERGVKHIEELISCLDEGYRTMILFIVKMKDVTHLEPNDRTHPAFGNALRKAVAAGVVVHAVDCIVSPDGVAADCSIPVKL